MRIAKIISYAQWQKFLVCAGARHFGIRKRRSIRYAQAQSNLLRAGVSHFGMRKRRSFCYAKAQVILVCAGANHFIFMRRHRSDFQAQAQAQLIFVFLCAGHLFGNPLHKFHLKHIVNIFFRGTYSYFSNNLHFLFFI